MCSCGRDKVVCREIMIPCYDDGGGLDSFDVEITFDIECYTCMSEYNKSSIESDDSLPF